MNKQIIFLGLIILLLASLTVSLQYTVSSTPVSKVAVLFFDDGWANQMQVIPTLQQYGFGATFAIISGYLTNPNYLTASQVQTLSQDGFEIASHTVDHYDLTTLSVSQLICELSQSQITLQALTGKPVMDIVFPNCAYNAQVWTYTYQYYKAFRSADINCNGIYTVFAGGETLATFQNEVAQYQVGNTVYICYHQITNTPGAEATSFTLFQQEMSWLHSSGYNVESMATYLGYAPPMATPTPSPTPIPTLTPIPTPAPMTSQDWQTFYSWLNQQPYPQPTNQTIWQSFLSQMLNQWKTQNGKQ